MNLLLALLELNEPLLGELAFSRKLLLLRGAGNVSLKRRRGRERGLVILGIREDLRLGSFGRLWNIFLLGAFVFVFREFFSIHQVLFSDFAVRNHFALLLFLFCLEERIHETVDLLLGHLSKVVLLFLGALELLHIPVSIPDESALHHLLVVSIGQRKLEVDFDAQVDGQTNEEGVFGEKDVFHVEKESLHDQLKEMGRLILVVFVFDLKQLQEEQFD